MFNSECYKKSSNVVIDMFVEATNRSMTRKTKLIQKKSSIIPKLLIILIYGNCGKRETACFIIFYIFMAI